MNVIRTALLALLAVCAWSASARPAPEPAAGSVAIEFTYFWPGRGDYSKDMQQRFGEPWTWPLQSMPHDKRDALERSYGLVYWPGEVVELNLTGSSASRIDRITVSTELGSAKLVAQRGRNNQWTIAIPENLPPAPYFALHRVHAFAGGTELASRGLVVARPWSGVFRTRGSPNFSRTKFNFGEWVNGSNPFSMMLRGIWEYWLAPDDTWYPWRERPYQDDDLSLIDLYFPRHKYDKYFPDKHGDLSTEAYLDPSFEWNYLWCYHGRGLGRWYGNWTWGPFDRVSASWIRQSPGVNVGFHDMRRVSGAFPNGLLFWQWAYPGTLRLALRGINHGNPVPPPEVEFSAYDGWAADSLTSSWTDSPGMIQLYWHKCRQDKADLAWADGAEPFSSLMSTARERLRQGDSRNHFASEFVDLDLARLNFYCLKLAANDAYKQTKKTDTVGFRSGLMGTPIWEGTAMRGLAPDTRPKRDLWNRLFNNGFGAGAFDGSGNGDHTHLHYLYNGVDRTATQTRYYRWRGYQGASQCALWPQCYYGGGNGDRMPGFPPGTGNMAGGDVPQSLYDVIDMHRDDGVSYRRFEINDRLPMFVREDGRISGAERESFFGSTGGYGFAVPNRPEWVTQIAAAMHAMEIPDRLRPLGGALVMDSSNADARAVRQDYVRENITDYATSLHDLLGVVTFSNPDTAPILPRDVARIHAPKHDGAGAVVLLAEVGQTRIVESYGGIGHQRPEQLRAFAERIRAAMPGGWPIRTTGGFVASAWESSRGIWVVVENPVEAPGKMHTPRQGSVSIRCRGLAADAKNKPAVVDLCGGEDPDPQRVPEADIEVKGDWVAWKLDWKRGDCRVFMIDHTAPSDAPAPSVSGRKGTKPAARKAAPAKPTATEESGQTAPATKAAPPVQLAELSDPAAANGYAARLLALVRGVLAANDLPAYTMSSSKLRVLILAVDERDTLTLKLDGTGQLMMPWKAIPPLDRLSLARDLARSDNPDAQAVLAFFLMLNNQSEGLDVALVKAGEQGEAVRACFKQTGGP
jgi:hypothetical protein